MNCLDLMEISQTGITLLNYNSDQVGNSTRWEKIQILMQGLHLPEAPVCASDALPAPEVHLASRPLPLEPIIFSQLDDKTSRARIQSKV